MNTTQNIIQACQTGQSVAGSAYMVGVVEIPGCPTTVGRLKTAYQVREVLPEYALTAFDGFVAARGNKFRKTEAQFLDILTDCTVGDLPQVVKQLRNLVRHFNSVGWPKGSKAIWAKWGTFPIDTSVGRRIAGAKERERARKGLR